MLRPRGRGAGRAALTAAFFSVFSTAAVKAQPPPPAQETTPPAAPSPAPTPAPSPAVSAQGQGSTGVSVSTETAPAPGPVYAAPEAAPAGPEAVEAETDHRTDHERVVGGWGVGLLSSVTLEPLLPGPAYPEQPLVVAILGARTWFSESFGLEVGLGFNTTHGTRSDDLRDREDVPDPTLWGLALHLGVPLSFYDDEHYQFLILPELNFGMAVGRTEDDPNLDGDQAIRQRARLVGGGLRAGAEVQFGMIGLPMLALTGTVGVRLNYHQASVEAAEDGVVVTRVRSGFAAATSSFSDPWDVFVSSIAALYYFR